MSVNISLRCSLVRIEYLIGVDGIDLNLEAAFSVSGDRVFLRNLPLYMKAFVGSSRALAFLRDLLRLPSFGDDERIPDEDGNIEFTPLSFAILRIIEDTPHISMPFGLDVIRTFISAGARTHRPPGDLNQAVQHPYDIVTSNWHRNGRRIVDQWLSRGGGGWYHLRVVRQIFGRQTRRTIVKTIDVSTM